MVHQVRYKAPYLDHASYEPVDISVLTEFIASDILNSPLISKASYEALRKLIDDIKINLEALKVLEVPIKQWDIIQAVNVRFDSHQRSNIFLPLPTYLKN